MIQGVVFDIGGVLAYDISEYLFYAEGTGLISKFGLDSQAVFEIDEKYAYQKIGNQDNWQETERQFWKEMHAIGLNLSHDEYIAITQRYVRPVPHMMDLVQTLKDQGLDLLICSNNTEFWFQRVSQLLDFPNFFEARKIILSNHFGASKNDPKHTLFKEVEKQMDHKKEAYVFVDDCSENIQRGLEFGLTPIHFPTEAAYGSLYLKRLLEQLLSA